MSSATESFKNAQDQFNESQQRATQLWDESQKQLIDSQKKLVDSWMQSFSDKAIQMNLSESFEKMLSFQQELISSVLDSQRISANLAVEAQKQFWENYFQTTQKMAEQTKSN